MREFLMKAIEYLIKALFLFLGGVVTYYVKTVVIPWMNDKEIYTTVKRYVQAAEKLASTGEISSGAEKKNFVLALLRKKGLHCTPEVEALIESAVQELDQLKKQATEALIDGQTAETLFELRNGKEEGEDV